MWGRLVACAAVGYRRCPAANARGTLWVGPIANRPQLTKLPHKSAPCLVYAYAQFQAVLLMNRVDVHFHVAHPLGNGTPFRLKVVIACLA